jgi:hypothetical protein
MFFQKPMDGFRLTGRQWGSPAMFGPPTSNEWQTVVEGQGWAS